MFNMLRHLVFLLATSLVAESQYHVRHEYRQLSTTWAWNSTTTPSPTSSHASGVAHSTTSGSTTDVSGSATGATILQQTTTSNGQVQTIPVMLGGIFTSPVTLEPPNTTPLDPTGEPAKSSAKTISSSYSSISADITSWLQAPSKNQAHATAIRDDLQKILPRIGSLVHNLADGDKNLAKIGDCQTPQKKKSRSLLSNLFGSLNDILCSTTGLINSFTIVTQTTNSNTMINLAKDIQDTIGKFHIEGFFEGGGGGDGNQGKSSISTQSTKSTQSTDSTTSSASSSTSCTQKITATYESVFCTSITTPSSSLQRRQECSSLIYSTVTGCSGITAISNSVTTTTTTIQAQETPYNPFCSPSTCGTKKCSKKRSIIEEDNSENLEKRDWEAAPRRLDRPVLDGEWAGPEYYGGRGIGNKFFRGEVYLAYTLSNIDPTRWGSVEVSEEKFDPNHPTTSHTRVWAGRSSTVALTGLFGCTAVVILSKRGVWVLHIWETPSFTGEMILDGFEYPEPSGENSDVVVWKTHPPTFEDDAHKRTRFEHEVLGAMRNGGSLFHLYGLSQLHGGDPLTWGNTLDDDAEPEAVIFHPRPAPRDDDPHPEKSKFKGKLRYIKEVGEIRHEIYSALGTKTVIAVTEYWPRLPRAGSGLDPQARRDYMRDPSDAELNGKILIQYKPAVDCNGEASYRLWHEGNQLKTKSWSPLPGQIAETPTSKRDNSSACAISASASSISVPASQTSTLTTPTAPSSIGLQATAPASPASCYNSLNCYKVVAPATAYSKSDTFCSGHKSINGTSTGFDSGPTIQYAFNDFLGWISYHWMVSWKPNCIAADGQGIMNVGQPIPAFSCQDAMRLAVDGCNNDGGVVEVGCLQYYFHPVNQSDSSCSLPFV
ncbi:hypothetical protein GGR54DRAFT_79194 [Hypoxylon sp. NC1633]|nr:hypothetical protein GGR54DRAFT_79194 [Hypoxylon sp. NC1633]